MPRYFFRSFYQFADAGWQLAPRNDGIKTRANLADRAEGNEFELFFSNLARSRQTIPARQAYVADSTKQQGCRLVFESATKSCFRVGIDALRISLINRLEAAQAHDIPTALNDLALP
ncbi:hypothetical protein [Sinorhizobium psoraleae]|uniref:Uncharacterized protein n=1 Tax=Sinorhizobium psoraleae TaxID=520838 RepID=A0ABT4KPD0_9HYPH|nr:hypothetical protein [Sinorhizobium psoraleae]MCZ4093718.1 hypothetical protein [Sinorhizobium psoraleae]